MIGKISSPVFNGISNKLNTAPQPKTSVQNNHQNNNDTFKDTAFYGRDIVQTQ